MDLPQVESCLCGLLDLKTGTLIVSLVTLFVTGGTFGYQYSSKSDSLLQTIMSLLVLIAIISSVLAIIGVLMNNKPLIQIYVISYTILLLAVIVIFALYLLGTLKVFYGNKNEAIVSTIIYILVVGYCVIVANSYCQSV